MDGPALRSLLLPLDTTREARALDVFAEHRDAARIALEDAGTWVDSMLREWETSGAAPRSLVELSEALLVVAADSPELAVSHVYFGLHEKLTGRKFGLSWWEARSILSHVRAIAELRAGLQMTAPRIARLLGQDTNTAARDSRAIGQILDALKLKRELNWNLVRQLMEEDGNVAIDLLGDSTLNEASSLVEEVARRFGVAGSFGDLLREIASDSKDPFGPYLQMLHFLLIACEFYDHFLREAYEFNPRGAVAEAVFETHPTALKAHGNPFLNNAKRARVLDLSWAEGADDNLRAARALSRLLEALDSLPHLARRELARYVRCWLLKVFDKYADRSVRIPDRITPQQFERLLGAIASRPSNSGGVLEQRLVDSFIGAAHAESEWTVIGVSDSVNATNAGRKKCGDVEALHRTKAEIVAYEVHAGRMSSAYVEGHLRSLERTLRERREDLEARAAATDWRIKVRFVAHGRTNDLPVSRLLSDGWTIQLEYLSFADLPELAITRKSVSEMAGMFSQVSIPALQSSRTPSTVRKRFLQLAAA
jgi:hypothetical protein